MVLVAATLLSAPMPSLLASVTTQVTVRLVDVEVGSSPVFSKVTDCNAVWYWATVAVPVKVNTPPTLLAIEIPFWAVKAKTSSVSNPALMVTTAPVSWISSKSDRVTALMAAAAPPSV